MSVLCVEEAVYDRVAYMLFLESGDHAVKYSRFKCFRGMSFQAIDVMVNNWYGLNQLTYFVAYKKDCHLSRCTMKRCNGGDNFTTVVFLKWLQCIRQNISIPNLEKARLPINDELKESVKLLDRLITDVLTSIVESTPEYQAAPWGELPNNNDEQELQPVFEFSYSLN
ncbi:hypothetical protein [Chitinophaga sp. CF418]|uniref:hypothetical protein n=1 Tax=Chitinophaga sp. CF418 TaxID=1855287 RepID=UPI0009120CC3|nr:hypothetical protein [Chitinophaga sp. CF418]SHN45562.1 hypothetical protein SAMN05216311_120109 [Chitinophaga sp. CF418]